MANEKFSQLPQVTSATVNDIICAVQGGVSVQETLQQVLSLGLGFTILSNPGNPNGVVAGSIYQFCYDTTNKDLYVCTTTGGSMSAVWTLIGANIVDPVQGGTGVGSPAANTLPVANGTSPFSFLGPLTNGQLLIGSTATVPVPATLTAGSNITISSGPGSITIAASGTAGFSWVDVIGTSQAMAQNTGYVADNAALVTLTLPATAAFGTIIRIIGKGAGGWVIAQNANQNIIIRATSTTVGTGGSVASTASWNAINLVCTVANTTWQCENDPLGILTVV